MYYTKHILPSVLSAITLAVIGSAEVQAQDAAVTTQANADQEKIDIQLERIMVTSQRRVENLQSTPLSVFAVGAGRIAELGVNEPQTLSDFVPNVSMGDGTGRGSGGSQFTIRGVGEARISPVLDPAVGIYIDDVYYGRPQTAFLKLLDIDKVEVLRGPQGTLFGKNSTGGALRYITQKPRFDDMLGYVKTTVGNYNRLDVKGAVNLPLSDEFAIRMSAAALSRDGFVKRLSDNQALGNENTNYGSVQFRWRPEANLDIHLGVDYTKRNADDGPTKLIDYFGYNGAADVGGGASTGNWNRFWGDTPFAYAPEIPSSLYEIAGTGRPGINNSESTGVSLNINYLFDNGVTFKSITGYRSVDEYLDRDPDDQANAYTYFDDITEEGTDFLSQELQLSGLSFDNRLNWVTGVFYSKDKPFKVEFADRSGMARDSYGAIIANDNAQQETRSFGVYAQGTYDVTEQLALTLGLRYTRDDKTYTLSQVTFWDQTLADFAEQLGAGTLTPTSPCDPRPTGSCVSQEPVSGGDVFSSTTPRFALEYQWTDDVMTYVSASKGFKAGGTNDSVADIDTPFQPEELWSYEAGIRSEFLNNRARLNLTYFDMDYEGKQITVAPTSDYELACYNRCTTNAGDASISGWEMEAQFAATQNLQLHANVGLLDAEWTSVIPGAGVSLGTPFARTPELSYNLGGRYNFELDNGMALVASVDYAYKDEQQSSPQESTTLTIPEYNLLNLRLSILSPSGDWSVSLFCSNCANEEYITGGAAWAGSTDNTPFDYRSSAHPAYAINGGTVANLNGVAPPGISLVNVGAPRMVGLDFKYDF